MGRHMSNIVTLFSRGTITEHQAAACIWYQDRAENATTDKTRATDTYGTMTIHDPIFGARRRRESIPQAGSDVDTILSEFDTDHAEILNAFLLENMTMSQLSRRYKCRFYKVADRLHRAIETLVSQIDDRIDLQQYVRELTTSR